MVCVCGGGPPPHKGGDVRTRRFLNPFWLLMVRLVSFIVPVTVAPGPRESRWRVLSGSYTDGELDWMLTMPFWNTYASSWCLR